jgi:putative tryptophan/tyrosine transport system substrate-binding protein
MRRREVLAFLGAVAGAPPLATRGEQPDRVRQIGLLSGLAPTDPEAKSRIAALRDGLRALGWIDGGNIRILERWAAGDVARTQNHAQELAGLAPDVIVVNTPPGLAALQKATVNVPIVFVQVVDAAEGVVTSIANPAGNVTGFYNFFDFSIIGKWLEMLREIAPDVRRVAVMQNPEHPAWARYLSGVRDAAHSFGVGVTAAPVRSPEEIDRAVEELAREPNGALLVLADSFTAVHRERIVGLAARHRVPAIYPLRYFPASGGLLSYGADLVDLFRRAASYVDRILRNARPGDLPIQQASKFELVINLKTAKALGLTIPQSLLARADEVIE